MTKRAAKRFLREGTLDTQEYEPERSQHPLAQDSKIRRINVGHGHWGPNEDPRQRDINGGRDQSYVKTIKPKSDGQTQLIEAIDDKNLVLALGPAGTGKTLFGDC